MAGRHQREAAAGSRRSKHVERIVVGARVAFDGETAAVRYVGPAHWGPGTWCGIEFVRQGTGLRVPIRCEVPMRCGLAYLSVLPVIAFVPTLNGSSYRSPNFQDRTAAMTA